MSLETGEVSAGSAALVLTALSDPNLAANKHALAYSLARETMQQVAGEAAVPPLLRLLREGHCPDCIDFAVGCLGQCGPKANAAIPDVIKLLESEPRASTALPDAATCRLGSRKDRPGRQGRVACADAPRRKIRSRRVGEGEIATAGATTERLRRNRVFGQRVCGCDL